MAIAISANICCTICSAINLLPNCTRVCAYFPAACNAASAMPTEIAPTKGRDASNVRIAHLKPLPSRPSRADSGTKQSVSTNSEVAEARMPILSSTLPTLKPSVSVGTMNAVSPRTPRAGLALAKTTTTSAIGPLVIKCFVPFKM